MSPRPQILEADPRWAVLRAAFVSVGLSLLVLVVLAPATTLFLAGLALAFGIGQGVATLRRGADDRVTGNGLLLEHE